jgi:hypothetical protein
MSELIKAISMIVAIEDLIPDRRAGYAQRNPAPLPTKPNIYPDEEVAEASKKMGSRFPKSNPLPPRRQTCHHAAFAPDTRVPSLFQRTPFARRR